MKQPDGSPDSQKLNSSARNLAPFGVLESALSHVPGLKILFGVVAVLAILAMARVWSLDRGWTVVGGVAVVALAFVLLVLARLSRSRSSEFRGPAKVLMWFCVALFMIWCALLTTCVFFKWPISVQMLPLSPVDQDASDDAIVGNWRWTPSEIVKIKSDGTMTSEHNGDGVWKKSGYRAFVLSWKNGFVDTLSLSADGRTLTGQNQYGKQPNDFTKLD